jgi:hypothetical protein
MLIFASPGCGLGSPRELEYAAIVLELIMDEKLMKQTFNRLKNTVKIPVTIVMKYTMLILLSLISLNTYSQKIVFTEKQNDSINVKLDSILILGIGSTPTRIFLDDLSNKLVKEFSKKHISVSYFFLGEDVAEAKREFAKINMAGYKAILWFLPKGSVFFDNETYTRRRVDPITGRSGAVTHYSVLKYKQAFDFQLYKTDKNNERFWNAEVDINDAPGKKSTINTLADKLLEVFKKHNYIQ